MLKKKEAIAVLIGILFFAMLSYFTYSQITKQKKEKEFILDATIEEIIEKDDKSTLLIVSETTCAFEYKAKNIPSVPETYLIRINYNHLML